MHLSATSLALLIFLFFFFFFNDTAPTEIYTLSLHDALPIYLAPIDAANPAGLNIAPNFNIPKETTIPGKRTLNEGNLKELMGLSMTEGAAALAIDDKFMARDQLDASKLAIKEFTTKYPQYEYLNQQDPSIAMGTIRSIVGPSRFKTLNKRFVFDTLNNTVRSKERRVGKEVRTRW